MFTKSGDDNEWKKQVSISLQPSPEFNGEIAADKSEDDCRDGGDRINKD